MSVERSRGVSMIDVIDRVLDKGIVVDYCARVSLAGVDILTWIDARVIVASFDTYVQYAERIGSTGLLRDSCLRSTSALRGIDRTSRKGRGVPFLPILRDHS